MTIQPTSVHQNSTEENATACQISKNLAEVNLFKKSVGIVTPIGFRRMNSVSSNPETSLSRGSTSSNATLTTSWSGRLSSSSRTLTEQSYLGSVDARPSTPLTATETNNISNQGAIIYGLDLANFHDVKITDLDLQLTSNSAVLDLRETAGVGFKRYHHATWYVSNAKQTAKYFTVCFGFEPIAYKGLETGCKTHASHVVKNGHIIFEFKSPIVTKSLKNKAENHRIQEMHDFIRQHGDGVKDISFEVEDLEVTFGMALKGGATPVSYPHIENDSYGSVYLATVQVFDDLWHTLIEPIDYKGPFLPTYAPVKDSPYYELVHATAISSLPPVKFDVIDHCVQNEGWDKLERSCDIYQKIFGFHKFWSVDEKDVSTEYSALRSIVMASPNEMIKMPMNEPAKGICKSQIEEFLEFYNGPGVQHIALKTDDIISTVRSMRERGTEFINTPPLYYDSLLPRLLKTGVPIAEDLNNLKELGILIDFDENGYILQIFTKPLTDRPTFFLEIIQRHNHSGFGKGNFKALFQTIEQEQRLRGTLLKNN
jgi:4-hydroxyphenylpyruvate dioxygenase